ncbi:MAG: aminotransferase class I/II-fold pyridoxal phosphate-dependent enzyme, partial [Actinomycetota bacterium]
AAYAERREALIGALAARGIGATGRPGLNVWIPVPAEADTVRLLAERGWAVGAGERFRLQSPPAIRVTIARLPPAKAEFFAGDLAAALGDRSPAYV